MTQEDIMLTLEIHRLRDTRAALVAALGDILFAVTDDARNNDGVVDVAAIRAVATAALNLAKEAG